ncbi:unnamed protein product, partial [Prorocentrum cordatum]
PPPPSPSPLPPSSTLPLPPLARSPDARGAGGISRDGLSACSCQATEGRVVTPQQTDQLYHQIASIDVGVVKMSGCVSEWWFCSRWRTGQRLVNMLSVGVPAIVWGDAQGHLDVVEARWPP